MRWLILNLLIPCGVSWATVEVIYWLKRRKELRKLDYKVLNPEDLR